MSKNNESKGTSVKNTVIIILLIAGLAAIIGHVTYTTIKDENNIFIRIGRRVSSISSVSRDDYDARVNQQQKKYEEEMKEMLEKSEIQSKNMQDEYDKSAFNSSYENSYTGLNNNFETEMAIKNVIRDNLNNKRKIVVKYKNIKTKKNKELTNLISKLNKKQYMITYDYDANGYICQMNIEDV